MNEFRKGNELRRIIFGLSAIIRTPADKLPTIINHKLPDFMKYLAQLSLKMYNRRVSMLTQNKDAVERGDRNRHYDYSADSDETSGDSENEELDNEELNNENLYQSRIHDICELQTLKDTLVNINKSDEVLYNRLMSGLTDANQLNKFQEVMGACDNLTVQENKVK